ncbi:hypothetical protein [Niabella drilacis]|uniref:Uncharacterized protein n=1 Tax=Niabella drilacis (strain DSM 25811 / CCM 8410 / CCUG 62505 / LMG 26954 / E90) TaxID=1285928 RepID=A0A1G7AE08_NIADE|nr:hypothetical protein [Niabella drilacis]SDE13051.1 hypothetical protein SAMN04487894_12261 [Niabella drilacis]
MKKNTLPALMVLLLAVFMYACKKDNTPIDPQSTYQKDVEKMIRFFKAHEPAVEKFTVDAGAGSTITLQNGTKITFGPNAFVKPGGAIVTGNVAVAARVFIKPSEMILADKPPVTDAGQILETFGEAFVTAEQNGQQLALNPQQKPPNVQVPIAGVNANGANREIPMWDGDTTVSTEYSGYNHENVYTTITQTYTIKKGMAWAQIPGSFGVGNAATTYFPLDNLGDWRNCDALYNVAAPKTTVLGYFGDKFNIKTGNNYSGQDPTELFFKVSGVNTLVKLYNPIFNPIAGKEGLLSYQNSVPIGANGTFLAMSTVNGKFYAEMRDVTITPDAGKNFMGITFNLQEVSEAQLLQLIQQMNTK